MSIPVTHLAQEAVAALVDGELSCGAAARAARHLSGCLQCRMAVQAQREAKRALQEDADVAVPIDLLSRLRDIPFTAEMPGGGPATLFADRHGLTDSAGTLQVPMGPTTPSTPPGHARWFRRTMVGMVSVLAVSVAGLSASLPVGDAADSPRTVAGPESGSSRTEVVPPVVRTLTVGSHSTDAAGTTGGTP